jgi:hypothetical protein
MFQRVESCPRDIQLVEHGERQRQDHEISRHFSDAAGTLECDLVPTVRGFR